MARLKTTEWIFCVVCAEIATLGYSDSVESAEAHQALTNKIDRIIPAEAYWLGGSTVDRDLHCVKCECCGISEAQTTVKSAIN